MIKKQLGFTLIELIITMALFIIAITVVTNVFVPLLGQFKQQSKTAETQIQGIAGLEALRRDIDQAGFGLPWVIPSGVTYQESTGTPAAAVYNDPLSNPPRAIWNGVGAGLGGSDYLVIRATSVASNDAAPKWTYAAGTNVGGAIVGAVKSWGNTLEDLNNGNRVIVLIPSRGASETSQRILVNNGSIFSVSFNQASFPTAFSPGTLNDMYLIYGVDSTTDLRMPFNRADYYLSSTKPAWCAPGTGSLVKAVVKQTDGTMGLEMPLMDCVADMQVIFGVDSDNDGQIDGYTNGLGTSNAQDVRDQVKEVRVYILAQEGQKDLNYTYPSSTITLPVAQTPPDPASGAGRPFDLTTIGSYQNYRWKVYSLIVKPKNLR